MSDMLTKPTVQDLIVSLLKFKERYGNVPVTGEAEGQTTFRLWPLREDATDCTHKPEDTKELFLQIY